MTEIEVKNIRDWSILSAPVHKELMKNMRNGCKIRLVDCTESEEVIIEETEFIDLDVIRRIMSFTLCEFTVRKSCSIKIIIIQENGEKKEFLFRS